MLSPKLSRRKEIRAVAQFGLRVKPVKREIPSAFALSKIPTSHAKNAREMGHPGFSFPLVGRRPMGTQGRLFATPEKRLRSG